MPHFTYSHVIECMVGVFWITPICYPYYPPQFKSLLRGVFVGGIEAYILCSSLLMYAKCPFLTLTQVH